MRMKRGFLFTISSASLSLPLAQLIPPHHRPRLGLCLAATLEVLPDGPSWSVLLWRGEARWRWHAAGGPVVVVAAVVRYTTSYGKGEGCEGVQVLISSVARIGSYRSLACVSLLPAAPP